MINLAIDYNVISWQGTMSGGEVWSTSCAYQTNFGTGPVKAYEDLAAWAQAAADVALTGLPNLADGLSGNWSLRSIRAAYIDFDGITNQVAEYQLPTPYSGSGASNMPYQCAVVLSLLTGRPGRSYRGRMYWPAAGYALATSNAQLDSTTTAGIASDASNLITDVGAAAGTDFAMLPSVYSARLGTTTYVTSVRVGSVIDTQRRRRNSLQETYSIESVPPPA